MIVPVATEASDANSDQFVARPTRTGTWNLLRGGTATASAYAVCRPDRRWFVSVDAWDEQDHDPLINAMIADLNQNLHTRIDGTDETSLERWTKHGFVPDRRELEFLLSPDPQRTGLAATPIPDGLTLLPADEVDETALRQLDDRLREEVPGADGWINDPAEFHEYTYDEKHFDPATYLVAVDDDREQFAGLVRVWANGPRSRLGLIGVTRAYRRRGVARALLAAAFKPLHERGVSEVLAEVDASNTASLKLMESIAAVETGASLVLRRSI